MWNPPSIRTIDFRGLESGSFRIISIAFHHRGWSNVIMGVTPHFSASLQRNHNVE